LREQCNIGCKISEIPCGSDIPAIDIKGVAHALESVKRDANGQDDLRDVKRKTGKLPSQDFRKVIEHLHEKGEILEIGQQPHIHENGDGQHPFFASAGKVFPQEDSGKKIHCGGKEHQQGIFGFPPPVKYIAYKQQQMGFGNLPDPVAEKNDRGEEVKKENVAVKNHQEYKVFLKYGG
jgi:hypothetical protein